MKIEIISGSYGWRKTKDAMPKLVERGGICEVDEAEARRLVALGVAAIVHEADEAPVASGSTVESGDTPCADMPSEENGAESGAEAHLDAEQLQEMTVAQLKELAAELGIEEGDEIRLYNDRGSVTLLAVLNAGQQRKSLHCPRSFLTREHIDGDLARTTFNDYNQACRNQSYFDCAVAIEKL